MIDLKSIINLEKVKLSTLISIVIVSIVCLIIPESIFKNLGIVYLFKYKWVSFIFLIISVILLLAKIFEYLRNYINTKKTKSEFKKERIRILNELDKTEKSFLKIFYDEQQNNLTFDYESSAVKGLLSKGVLVLNDNYIIKLYAECRINDDFKKLIDPNTFFK